MAYGYYLEAEYKDGHVHNEQYFYDKSPFAASRNIFDDIAYHRLETAHGKLVRLSMLPEGVGKRYDIDWTRTPKDSVPIYYRHMHRQFFVGGGPASEPYASSHTFGYAYIDKAGKPKRVTVKANMELGT